MKNKKAKLILKQCLKKIKDMSQEDFDKIINEKNICNVTYVLQKYTDNRFVLNLTTETKEFENDISSINYDTNPKKENHKIIVKNDIVEDRIYLAA
ncbi:hypothetical protein QTH42_15625 [Clostridium perfringens]|nr:hypothetical protein [Clostridium perfringens]